jgi:transcription antitermination factor NusG
VTTELFSEFVWRTFVPGTSVVVAEGPLQGLRGTVVGLDQNERLVVEITVMSSSVSVKCDPTGVYLDDAAEPRLVMH